MIIGLDQTRKGKKQGFNKHQGWIFLKLTQERQVEGANIRFRPQKSSASLSCSSFIALH